ncbi:MAG TPA: LPS export ABC transporter periplasmic protein LptC [Helicobacteraceae bacterium]|nr:LPS export ABC transporter periplasmic protein LptC [Helicobacteraceae bacterium]
MNVNHFFLIIAFVLGAIFIFFKPLDLKFDNPNEVAQLELETFTVYELTKEGLKSITKGSRGERYENRNEANDIDFTDNSKQFSQNMKADFGRQQDNKVMLNGNVRYKREDGLIFKSQEAAYNQKSTVVTTKGDFNMYYGDNWVEGTKLYYDATKRQSKSDNVTGLYDITKEQ